jgi:hypothetical protein
MDQDGRTATRIAIGTILLTIMFTLLLNHIQNRIEIEHQMKGLSIK